jgi:hypothetical protein
VCTARSPLDAAGNGGSEAAPYLSRHVSFQWRPCSPKIVLDQRGDNAKAAALGLTRRVEARGPLARRVQGHRGGNAASGSRA